MRCCAEVAVAVVRRGVQLVVARFRRLCAVVGLAPEPCCRRPGRGVAWLRARARYALSAVCQFRCAICVSPTFVLSRWSAQFVCCRRAERCGPGTIRCCSTRAVSTRKTPRGRPLAIHTLRRRPAIVHRRLEYTVAQYIPASKRWLTFVAIRCGGGVLACSDSAVA